MSDPFLKDGRPRRWWVKTNKRWPFRYQVKAAYINTDGMIGGSIFYVGETITKWGAERLAGEFLGPDPLPAHKAAKTRAFRKKYGREPYNDQGVEAYLDD